MQCMQCLVPIRANTDTSPRAKLYVVDIGQFELECRQFTFAKAWKVVRPDGWMGHDNGL